MAEFISKFGHKTFRANQLLRWIYKDYVHQFDVMSDIAKDFRQVLSDHASIIAPDIKFDHVSTDGTRKWLLEVGASNVLRWFSSQKKNEAHFAFHHKLVVRLNVLFAQLVARDLTEI